VVVRRFTARCATAGIEEATHDAGFERGQDGSFGGPVIEPPCHWVIDRIEGEWAVVDRPDGTSFDLPLWMLPEGSREGDVLRVTVGRDDPAATWRI
jgi:hypothetical protein